MGIALRLPDGWTRTEKLDDLQYMSGVVLGATGPNDQSLTVAVVPYADPKPFADVLADQVTASGATVASAATVDLTSGTAARLVFSTTDGTVAMIAIGDGQMVDNCHAIPAGYLLSVVSTVGGKPDEATLDAVAQSIELDSAAAECGSTDGPSWSTPSITWSPGGHFGKFSDNLFVLMTMPDGTFLALGSACAQANPDGGPCPGGNLPVAWLGGADGRWKQVAFPASDEAVDMVAQSTRDGIVAVQTTRTGGAIVWAGRDGEVWTRRSVIGEGPGCTDIGGSPFVTALQFAGSVAYVTGDQCVAGNSVPTIYRSEDLKTWAIVDRVPAEATGDAIVTGLPEYAETAVKIGKWYVSFEADAGAIDSWAWLSPDGARWREIVLPTDIGFLEEIAGGDGRSMFVSSGGGWDGFDGRIAAFD